MPSSMSRVVSLQNVGRNALCNSLCRLMDRVVSRMSVACRRFDIAVAQQLTDHWQSLAERKRTGREALSSIVY